jgi:hypothetical protein
VLGTAILLLLAGGVAAGVVGLILREPGFYRRLDLPPGPQRQAASEEFKNAFFAFLNHLNERRAWDATFAEEQLNSFLREDFIHSNFDKQILPDDVSDPRIALEADRIRLAFRYHVGRWSTVLSISMRVWLAAEEPNVVALELQGMRAGSLPVSPQLLLERLTDAADRNNIKVSWYRHKGNPVALLRFQSEPQHSSPVVLEHLDLYPGKVYISGLSVEPGTPAAPAAP